MDSGACSSLEVEYRINLTNFKVNLSFIAILTSKLLQFSPTRPSPQSALGFVPFTRFISDEKVTLLTAHARGSRAWWGREKGGIQSEADR